MDALSTGASDLRGGLAALRAHPRCWKYLIAPAVVTALLLVAMVLGVHHVSWPLVHWVTLHLPHWLAGIAGGVLRVLVVLALSAAALVLFVPLAGLVAGPFAERLSEHLEQALTGRPPARFDFGEFIHGLGLAIGHGLRRVFAAIGAVVAVGLIGGIPVVGTIAALVLTLWFAAHGAAYDCYDAVLGRRLASYRDKLAYLARHRGRTMGLGGVVALLLLVPGVNLFALGLGAAGATVASLELDGALPVLPAARLRT